MDAMQTTTNMAKPNTAAWGWGQCHGTGKSKDGKKHCVVSD
jgi:hypothetical protein